MVDFCPECSSLLRKKNVNGKAFLFCRCGYEQEIELDEKLSQNEMQKKKSALEKNLIIASDQDKISIFPKMIAICPKCGYKEVETWQTQIRGADEPSTSFFRCIKCKFTWREN
jgi:transcription factor S